jgi:hypothetical protein
MFRFFLFEKDIKFQKHCMKMLTKSSVFITLVVFIELTEAKRGPHHPRGDYVVKRETRRQEFNEHLGHSDDNE